MTRTRLVHTMLCVAALAAATGVPHDPARSQSAPANGAAKFRDLHGEWRRAGAGFACVVGPAGQLAKDKLELLSYACLHMGPFMIGDPADLLKTTLGAPHKTIAQPNGASAQVYFLEAAGHYPYLVATVSKDRIIALQVTGPAAAKGYTYNHVDLGASTDTLVQVFGRPNHLEPSEEKDTELWAYRPWPFSFEVRDGHVTSIRINDPA